MPLTIPEQVVRAQADDQEAFTTLYKHFFPQVQGSVRRILRNRPEDVEDITQEVFATAFLKISTFTGKSQFGTWLTRIAINASLQLLRKQKKDQSLIPLEDFDIPLTDPRFAEFINHSTLESLISELPPEQQTELRLRAEGFTHAEIGQRTNKSLHSSKSTLERAKKSIRRKLRLRK